MALRDDFDPVRAYLLHGSPQPSLENAVAELMAKEIRLQTLQLSF